MQIDDEGIIEGAGIVHRRQEAEDVFLPVQMAYEWAFRDVIRVRRVADHAGAANDTEVVRHLISFAPNLLIVALDIQKADEEDQTSDVKQERNAQESSQYLSAH